MGGREERIARNESASREINERLEDALEDAAPERNVRMVCECGRETCDRVVAITPREYGRIHQDPRRFVIVREHLIPGIERVVEETDRYTVVAKEDGDAVAVAVEEDPKG